jgi:hypothetical protein
VIGYQFDGTGRLGEWMQSSLEADNFPTLLIYKYGIKNDPE